MPRGDRTGPNGAGPMTGRGLGYCTGHQTPGFTKTRRPRLGRARGRGFGRRAPAAPRRAPRRYSAQSTAPIIRETTPRTEQNEKEILKEEKEILKEEINELERELKQIEERIEEYTD